MTRLGEWHENKKMGIKIVVINLKEDIFMHEKFIADH